jgi:GGDEF domain-containing protein
LRHESSRHARYGRPVSVLLIELDRNLNGASLDRQARDMANPMRLEARDSDRAVRIGMTSFRVLLPETNARAARLVAARIERTFQLGDAGQAGPALLRIEIAAPTRGGSLEDALADAERRIGR